MTHRRRNPLTGDWVLVSPHRSERPWSGAKEPLLSRHKLSHDPSCHLCAKNMRASGVRNPDYSNTFVFSNDYPALRPLEAGMEPPLAASGSLFERQQATGACRVVCFSPDHSKTLPELTTPEVIEVVDTLCRESAELGKVYPWVQVFENKGATMGCSSPHPHAQVWATNFVPTEPSLEDHNQRLHFEAHGRRLLDDYCEQELAYGERVVLSTPNWLAVVPFWAAWPFETLLLPRFPVQRLAELTAGQRRDLADALRSLTGAYDALFDCSFPYSMGWHGAPYLQDSMQDSIQDPSSVEHWTLHAHFYPPLLRSATVKKFMVGFEMLCEAQRDLTPEEAASRLRRS